MGRTIHTLQLKPSPELGLKKAAVGMGMVHSRISAPLLLINLDDKAGIDTCCTTTRSIFQVIKCTYSACCTRRSRPRSTPGANSPFPSSLQQIENTELIRDRSIRMGKRCICAFV